MMEIFPVSRLVISRRRLDPPANFHGARFEVIEAPMP